jgi:hypothetical protein
MERQRFTVRASPRAKPNATRFVSSANARRGINPPHKRLAIQHCEQIVVTSKPRLFATKPDLPEEVP